MGNEGLGGLAKRWLTSKVKELTTADRRVREAAEYEAEESGRQFRNEAAGEALMTAIPGLRRLRDRQVEHTERAEAERERRVAEELAARPVAGLRLRVSGAVSGEWSGPIPASVVVDPDGSAGDGDPYAGQDALLVDLRLPAEADERIGGQRFAGWTFVVPGFSGDGVYDLAESGLARRAAGCEPEYIDWELSIGGDGEGFYFQPDAGPTTVHVSTAPDGTRTLVVTMSLLGAAGELRASAELVMENTAGVS